jgi:hypothetical protein
MLRVEITCANYCAKSTCNISGVSLQVKLRIEHYEEIDTNKSNYLCIGLA